MKPRIIFFGNTKYSVIDAAALHAHFGLAALVTIPDQPVGRKGVVTPSPTKAFALANTIPVLETRKLKDDVIEDIRSLDPDFLVVADYGLILPQRLLDIPKFAPLNIHHSLLPKYRGPAPAPSALLAGEKETGVTIIKMTNTVDGGDILAQKKYTLSPDDTTDSVLTILNTLGSEIILPVITQFFEGKETFVPQDETKATYTKYMEKNDGFIDKKNPPPPAQIDRMIRAYFPWPGVWTKLTINGSEKIVKFLPEKKIQVEGKNVVSREDFYNGYPLLKQQVEQLLGN